MKKVIVFVIFMLFFVSTINVGSNELSYKDEINNCDTTDFIDNELIINSGSGHFSHGDSIEFDLEFPEPPIVVTCAISGTEPVLSSPTNVDLNQFEILLINHEGNTVSNAIVNWIAFYPLTYVDDTHGLMIETGFGTYSNNEVIDYSIDFTIAPRVITSASKDGIPVASSIRGHYDPPEENFKIAILDHDYNGVSDAEVFWVAISPNFYENPDTNLKIESRYDFCSNNDYINYNMVFPKKPYVVMNGYSIHNTAIAAPYNFNLGGFRVYVIDQNGEPDDTLWLAWLAIYPYIYDERIPEEKLIMLVGSISDVNISEGYTLMNCTRVTGIQFRPIHIVKFSDNEELKVKNDYLGVISDGFIFGIFKRLI